MAFGELLFPFDSGVWFRHLFRFGTDKNLLYLRNCQHIFTDCKFVFCSQFFSRGKIFYLCDSIFFYFILNFLFWYRINKVFANVNFSQTLYKYFTLCPFFHTSQSTQCQRLPIILYEIKTIHPSSSLKCHHRCQYNGPDWSLNLVKMVARWWYC